MSIVLRFFPNGEFSQGVATASSKRPLTHVCKRLQTCISAQIISNADMQRCKEQYADIPSKVYAVPGYLFRGNDGREFSLISVHEEETVVRPIDALDQSRDIHISASIYRLVHVRLLTPIGLSGGRILAEASCGRKKLLSMTKNMGRNLRNAIYLLEETYGKDQLSFLTLTLPNLSRDGLASCCANWDLMVNLFTKWLRSRLELHLLELEYGYCTEIQPGRLHNRGEYAPHLHIVFRGRARARAPWAVSWLDCRGAWADIIKRFTDEQFDTRALENIQRIKKSAARYLSKYVSKGKNSIPQSGRQELAIKQLHTQWGGMSRNLSQAIRKRVVRLCSSAAQLSMAMSFLMQIEALIKKGYVRYFQRGFISLGISRTSGSEQGLHVGVGALSKPTHISLPECLQYISAMQTCD